MSHLTSVIDQPRYGKSEHRSRHREHCPRPLCVGPVGVQWRGVQFAPSAAGITQVVLDGSDRLRMYRHVGRFLQYSEYDREKCKILQHGTLDIEARLAVELGVNNYPLMIESTGDVRWKGQIVTRAEGELLGAGASLGGTAFAVVDGSNRYPRLRRWALPLDGRGPIITVELLYCGPWLGSAFQDLGMPRAA